VTIRNLECQGPGDLHSHTHTGDDRCLDMTPASDNPDHMLIEHVLAHGSCTELWMLGVTNAVVQYSEFYNTFDPSGANCHPDTFVVNAGAGQVVSYRYNKIHDWENEAFLILGGSTGAMQVFGNLYYSETNTNARLPESQMGANGPLLFYANVIDGITGGINTANSGTWATGSQGRDNIWYNTGCNGFTDEDFDFTSAGTGTGCGSNGIHSGSNPFVNEAAFDYHLISTIGAAFPRHKGTDLGSPYHTDMDGNTCSGSNCNIGAFQDTSAGGLGGIARGGPISSGGPQSSQ
jgi:hypothetical protein